MDNLLHTKAEVLKSDDDGIVEAVVASTSILDRQGEVIDQNGWELNNYQKNPVILWGHNIKEERPPIGRAEKVWVDGDRKKRLMFKAKFDLADSFAAEIFRKIKDKFLNTVSVGFMPLEKEDNVYKKSELLEISFVPVPANPQASIMLRSMHIEPVELEDLYFEMKPYPSEHACRLREPGDFQDGSFRRTTRDHEGKQYSVIMGKLKGETTMTEQAYRYKKETWTAAAAAAHCKSHDGSFEAASEEAGMGDNYSKGVIAFSATNPAPETAAWDGPGEMAKAEVSDLKIMCAWFDSENPDIKTAYKLPHHMAHGHNVVWRGVAAAMAALLGARGGPDIPEADKRGVYNHLAKHYKQFDKEAPEYRLVEAGILKELDLELGALLADHEDKYMVRLIKKTLHEIKKQSNKQSDADGQIKTLVKALKIVDNAVVIALKKREVK